VVSVRSHRRGDGTHVRAHTRRGPRRRATVGVALGAAVTVGVALPGPGGSLPVKPRVPHPSSTEARVRVEIKRIELRLKTKGFRATTRVDRQQDCTAHSYGLVRDYFRSHPCNGVTRAVIEVTDKRRNVVLIAVSRVDMPSAAEARQYKRLVDRDRTGNVTELSRDRGSYRSYRYTGRFYTSSIDGPSVENIQVEPVGWSPAVAAIDRLRRAAQP
jgi:hypothetical protein